MKLKLGGIIYLVGIGGAVLVGLLEGLGVMPEMTWIPWVLVIAGLLIGMMNISGSESTIIMVSALVLGAGAGVLSILPAIGGALEAIFSRIAFISLPVAIPTAVKSILFKSK